MGEEKEIIEAYITKYALTQGIFKCRGYIVHDIPSMFCVNQYFPEYYHNSGSKKEWTLDLEEAFKEAERLRDAKIKSLEKNLKKIKTLQIKVLEVVKGREDV